MGVAGFMAWLVKRYPLIVRHANWPSYPKFDCFFVDFNSIIYGALRKAECVIDASDQDEMFTEIFRYLDVMVRIVRPQKLLFIALDGGAPSAKCLEQRRRRFGRTAPSDADTNAFSTNAASVGTEFMELLHTKLMALMAERVKNDPAWRTPQIIYNSHRTPGEAEHNFFDFIRSQKEDGIWPEDATCCVHSPDADLVFISLQSRVKHFCVLRDNDKMFMNDIKTKNGGPMRMDASGFVFVYIDLVREYLLMEFGIEPKNADRLVDDFAAIMYTKGDDFVMQLPDVCPEKTGFGVIMKAYKKVCAETGKFLVEGDRLNLDVLGQFLCEAQRLNRRGLPNGHVMQQRARNFLSATFGDEFTIDRAACERRVVHAILDGFHWVLRYYRFGCASWSWFYKYTNVLPVSIIVEHLNGYEPCFEVDAPLTPFAQQLMIFPVSSASLVVAPLRQYIDPERRAGDLPDRQWIVAKVEEHMADMTPQEKERNTIIPVLTLQRVDDNLEWVATSYKDIVIRDVTTPVFSPSFFQPKRCEFEWRVSEKDEMLFIKQSFRVDEKQIDTLVDKVVLVGWPLVIPALVTGVKASDRMCVSTGIMCNSQQSVIVKPLAFSGVGERGICWDDMELSFPLDLTLPLSAINVMERFTPQPIIPDRKSVV